MSSNLYRPNKQLWPIEWREEMAEGCGTWHIDAPFSTGHAMVPIGERGTGKSRLLAGILPIDFTELSCTHVPALIDAVRPSQPSFAVIDMDIGQPLPWGVPGCVSVAACQAQPSSTSASAMLVQSFVVGPVAVDAQPDRMSDAIQAAVRVCVELSGTGPLLPVLVNTPGWVTGVGWQLLHVVVASLRQRGWTVAIPHFHVSAALELSMASADSSLAPASTTSLSPWTAVSKLVGGPLAPHMARPIPTPANEFAAPPSGPAARQIRRAAQWHVHSLHWHIPHTLWPDAGYTLMDHPCPSDDACMLVQDVRSWKLHGASGKPCSASLVPSGWHAAIGGCVLLAGPEPSDSQCAVLTAVAHVRSVRGSQAVLLVPRAAAELIPHVTAAYICDTRGVKSRAHWWSPRTHWQSVDLLKAITATTQSLSAGAAAASDAGTAVRGPGRKRLRGQRGK